MLPQAFWPDCPPDHCVTCVATIRTTTTTSCWTGDTDGGIVRWVFADAHSLVSPSALLCAHTAPIALLAPCDDAVLSACIDSALCVWVGETGVARKRGRLPVDLGRPGVAVAIPNRKGCVALSCGPKTQKSLSMCVSSVLLVLDTSTLTVLQRVGEQTRAYPPLLASFSGRTVGVPTRAGRPVEICR